MAPSPDRTHFAVGCDDGVVRVFTYIEGRGVEYVHAFAPLDSASLAFSAPHAPPAHCVSVCPAGRVLSVAWSPSGATLAAGTAQSGLYLLDVRSRRQRDRLAVEDKGAKEGTLVWATLWLDEQTLASGDSMGFVHIWDAVTGTVRQSIREHEGDVLALVRGEGDSLLVSGVDSKVRVGWAAAPRVARSPRPPAHRLRLRRLSC